MLDGNNCYASRENRVEQGRVGVPVVGSMASIK